MAAGNWVFYNAFRRHLGAGRISFSGGTFRMALFLSTSNAATATLSTYASLTNQVANANGYVTSGQALTKTWTSGASAGQWRFNYSPALVWTGTGGTITGVKFAVIFTDLSTTKRLICYSQLSTAAFNITINNMLTITAAATGVFNLQ